MSAGGMWGVKAAAVAPLEEGEEGLPGCLYTDIELPIFWPLTPGDTPNVD